MSSTTRSKIFVPRVLWASLLASQAVYVVVLTLPGVLDRPSEPPDPTSLVALIAAAIASAIMSFALPSVFRRAAIAQRPIPTRDVPDPDAVLGFRGAVPTVRRYVDPQRARDAAFAIGLTPFLVSLALSEAVSMLGLVAGVLGHDAVVWAPFVAAGMTLTALRFPTEGTFLAPMEQATGVPF